MKKYPSELKIIKFITKEIHLWCYSSFLEFCVTLFYDDYSFQKGCDEAIVEKTQCELIHHIFALYASYYYMLSTALRSNTI